MRADRVVVVFAKRPAPGAVKTRMCPPLTPEQAAALYAAMLDDVLATTAAAAAAAGAAAWLAVHPPDAVGELAARYPGFHAVPQCGADLAQRMERAVASAAAAGFARILLRGSDNPALPGAAIADGARGARRRRPRGGSRPRRRLWMDRAARPGPGPVRSPDEHRLRARRHARARGRARAARADARSHFDLDTAADLAWLAAARSRGEAVDCPRTLALLDEQGLWPA